MNFHLGLFFTRGVSLKTWDMVGNLDREIAIYLRMIKAGNQVTFVTYGGSGDLKYLDRLQGIGIACNEQGLDLERYESELPDIHGKILESLDLIKTNQTYGAEIASEVSSIFGKPFIARCGYMWSQNCLREHGPEAPITREAFRVENKVFKKADRIVVTTEAMRKDVSLRVKGAENKLVVIPNYVDTDVFRPLNVSKDPDTIIFIGRIAPEKNLEVLFEAIRLLNVRLRIIGEGRLRPHLQQKFADMENRLIWEGGIPNFQLPEYINGATAFILPSIYEGHPKALIEAMACSIPVIGCDSPGIREIINSENNGLLCATDQQSLRTAIIRVMNDREFAKMIAINAREFVMDNYSLQRIAHLELSLMYKTREINKQDTRAEQIQTRNSSQPD